MQEWRDDGGEKTVVVKLHGYDHDHHVPIVTVVSRQGQFPQQMAVVS